MKFIFLFIYSYLFLTGCVYEAPLTEKHEIKIDPAVLGLWEAKSEKNADEQMMILKFSDTEYLIHYPTKKDSMYLRAYPIKVGEQIYIQMQLLGSFEGPIKKDEKNPYTLATYQLANGELEIRTIKTKFMDNGSPTNGEFKNVTDLKNALLKSKDTKELFGEPQKFKLILDKK